MDNIKVYDSEKVKQRLFELRKSKNLSQNELGIKLNKMLNEKMNRDFNLNGENGKQTVSQLERKNGNRNLTFDLAFAYANIFNVSLDYILGWSNDFLPEYKDIKEVTGLSDEAIDALKNLSAEEYYKDNIIVYRKDDIRIIFGVINYFLCQKDFWNNFSNEILKIYKFNFDTEYRKNFHMMLDDNNVDLTNIIIQRISKQFEELLNNYIQEYLRKKKEEEPKLF